MLAGCVVLESVDPVVAGCVVVSVVAGAASEPAGVASVAGVVEAGGGRALDLPGVIVSGRRAPNARLGATLAFGCNPKPMVSSPDSLAGVSR